MFVTEHRSRETPQGDRQTGHFARPTKQDILWHNGRFRRLNVSVRWGGEARRLRRLLVVENLLKDRAGRVRGGQAMRPALSTLLVRIRITSTSWSATQPLPHGPTRWASCGWQGHSMVLSSTSLITWSRSLSTRARSTVVSARSTSSGRSRSSWTCWRYWERRVGSLKPTWA